MSEEQQLGEVEKTLLYISEARDRAERARRELERASGAAYLIEGLRASEGALAAEHRRLMQASFFAISTDQDRLAV